MRAVTALAVLAMVTSQAACSSRPPTRQTDGGVGGGGIAGDGLSAGGGMNGCGAAGGAGASGTSGGADAGSGGNGGNETGAAGVGGIPFPSGRATDGGGCDGSVANGCSAACSLPSDLSGVIEVGIRWCDVTRTFAMCSWSSGGPPVRTGTLTSCPFPTLVCPPPSGPVGPGTYPACDAHPDGEVSEGVLLQFYGPGDIYCSGFDSKVSDLPLDVTPCEIGNFVCVADCSTCP